jgi:hypothetical protein
MIEFEETVVQVIVWLKESWIFLIVASWNVAFVFKIFRPYLCNMHVNKESIKTIYFKQFILA